MVIRSRFRNRALTASGIFVISGVLVWELGAVVVGVQSTGTIRGLVKIDTVPDKVMVQVTTDQSICGDEVEDQATVVDPSGGVANAVVIVAGVPWGDIAPEPIINNVGCYFVPRVQVARTLSQVTVTSQDETLHTTHAYDDRQRTSFNIAIPVPGLEIKRPLRRPGVVRIECDSHGWMRGWVYVTGDVGTVSRTDGSFELSGIPAGTYKLLIWHERYEGMPQQVTVTGGTITEVNFQLQ